MAIKLHPDKGGDPEKFKELCEAVEILGNPDKKKNFMINMVWKVSKKVEVVVVETHSTSFPTSLEVEVVKQEKLDQKKGNQH